MPILLLLLPTNGQPIDYEPGSSGALKYCFVGYGGGEYSANIHAKDNDVTIEHSTIVYSNERGIYVESANPEIKYNTISANNWDGVFTTGGALPSLQYNNIVNNVNYGVYNADAGVDVNAINNWWGDISGPFHADHNPNGKGNKVSDHVLFQPWLENPVGGSTSVEEIEDSPIRAIYPNPVGDASIVKYHVKKPGMVHISVYDINGRKVLQLGDIMRNRGDYEIKINGSYLPRGLYLLTFVSQDGIQVKKIVKQ